MNKLRAEAQSKSEKAELWLHKVVATKPMVKEALRHEKRTMVSWRAHRHTHTHMVEANWRS